MTPWSVRPRAGWSKLAARSARASMRHAPSSTEYSEWTWRWANDAGGTGTRNIGPRPDGAEGAAAARSRDLRVFRAGVSPALGPGAVGAGPVRRISFRASSLRCGARRAAATGGIDSFDRIVWQVDAEGPYASARRVFWIVDNGSAQSERWDTTLTTVPLGSRSMKRRTPHSSSRRG